jgi:hypothetical protein
MVIPVFSTKAAESAAIAALGAVFSEMKFKVVPWNCFQSVAPPLAVAELDVVFEPPHAASRLGRATADIASNVVLRNTSRLLRRTTSVPSRFVAFSL